MDETVQLTETLNLTSLKVKTTQDRATDQEKELKEMKDKIDA
jgi:chaperonin cofactor prefoldin